MQRRTISIFEFEFAKLNHPVSLGLKKEKGGAI
jgi:hypothetical protein